MARSLAPLGDSHNFGRRVSVRGARIRKARTVFWEWLLLGASSPLRLLLAEAAERDGLGADAFDFLPELRFSRPGAREGGEVERVTLKPLPRLTSAGKRELGVAVGRCIALASWLGIADLHWENLVLGLGRRGQIVFAPLDVEMILADLSLPTETKLLPDADPEYMAVCQHANGVRRCLPFLGKPIRAADLVTIAAAYVQMLDFLDAHAREIAALVARLPGFAEAPIRVCLRGTDEYVRAGSSELWPPLLAAEAEQLARGDIPYFFRLYGQRRIHYYENRALTKLAHLPTRGDVPQLDPMLSLARGLRSPTRKKLREDGLFTLLGAFDHESFGGRHEHDALAVTFGARSLVVRLASGEELRSQRNLSALVSSVYLDCRCGEVRSVFVPAVTACRLGRGATA
jgi:hypothetical protein